MESLFDKPWLSPGFLRRDPDQVQSDLTAENAENAKIFYRLSTLIGR